MVRQIKEAMAKIGNALNVTGPFDTQFIAKNNEIKVIECNLRAARSFPFVSKVSDGRRRHRARDEGHAWDTGRAVPRAWLIPSTVTVLPSTAAIRLTSHPLPSRRKQSGGGYTADTHPHSALPRRRTEKRQE